MKNLLNCLLLGAVATFSGSSHAAGIREIRVPGYVETGARVSGTVTIDDSGPAPAGAKLRVMALRVTDIPASPTEKPGQNSVLVLERPVADGDVNFELDAAGTLRGHLRVHAEIIAGDGPALASAWSDPVEIGVRKRINLAGQWDVTKIEPLDVLMTGRPKGWKLPQARPVLLPGALIDDAPFRGWVSAKRNVTWSQSGDLQPRFVRMSNITDSAAVSIDGVALPETRPIEVMAILSHWIEFHSKLKGDANAKNRMLMLDLWPQGEVNLPLPKPLAQQGSASVEIRVRATSGMFRPHPLPAIRGDLHLEMTPAVYVKNISFDTEKPADNRRFKFNLTLGNDTGKEFHGTLRNIYGQFEGKIPYTGNCPAYASADQPIVLKPGENSVEVVREEKPRFATCQATFVLISDAGKIIDGDNLNFHTVTMEIRDRRDLYLNNERFIVKAQGSAGDAPHKRFQFRVMGGNGFRGAGSTSPDELNLYLSEGLLSAGGPLLASVEKCVFFNTQDTTNIDKAVKRWVVDLGQCPGLILWEATNELHGEPEDARIAMLSAFHKFDPYHRPVFATKGSGEWEAEARDGKVQGVDIVGCQYLLSKEGVDSITAAVTEQPIMSTEVNWNDISFSRDKLWNYWMDKGVCGSLLFDYSGRALDQPTPAVPLADSEKDYNWIKKTQREMYQDLVASAAQEPDGTVHVRVGNQEPYPLHNITLRMQNIGRFTLPDLTPGMAVSLDIPASEAPPPREPAILRAEYTTHGGLPHIAILTPTVTPAPVAKGGGK